MLGPGRRLPGCCSHAWRRRRRHLPARLAPPLAAAHAHARLARAFPAHAPPLPRRARAIQLGSEDRCPPARGGVAGKQPPAPTHAPFEDDAGACATWSLAGVGGSVPLNKDEGGAGHNKGPWGVVPCPALVSVALPIPGNFRIGPVVGETSVPQPAGFVGTGLRERPRGWPQNI